MDAMDAILGLSFGLLLILFLFYLLPTFIAFARGHLNRVPILLVNLFLGWSFLGWIVALIWSFTSNTKANAANRSSGVTAGVASLVAINVNQPAATSGETSVNRSNVMPSGAATSAVMASPSGGSGAIRVERECPECGERILSTARKCKHCGSAVEPVADAAATSSDALLSGTVTDASRSPASIGDALVAHAASMPEVGARNGARWFYEKNGEKRGPVTADEMVRRIRVGSLARGSMVWTEGFPAWTAIESTELGAHVAVSHASVVSAPVGESAARVEVNNAVVWILAFAPILGVVLETVVAFVVYGGDHARVLDSVNGSSFWYVTLALNSILCLIDEKNLEQAGVDEGLFKWVLLVPVYIYKRAKAVGDDLSYFITWFVSVVIAAFLMTSAIPAVLEGTTFARNVSAAFGSMVDAPGETVDVDSAAQAAAAAEEAEAAAAEAERMATEVEAERVAAEAEAERVAAYEQQMREYEEEVRRLQAERDAMQAATKQVRFDSREAGPTRDRTTLPVESAADAYSQELSAFITPPSTQGRGARISQPEYPPASRRAGEAGTVALEVYVLDNGRVGDVRVAKSTGFDKLDEAAIREVQRNWRLVPGEKNGVPTPMWHSFSLTFRLTD